MNLNYWINATCAGGIILGLFQGGFVLGAEKMEADDSYQSELFGGRIVPRVEIQISAAGIRQLGGRDIDNWRQRPSALATVTEGARTYTNVELHLKGGAGSYRPIENNPALTLEFSKHALNQTFHGLNIRCSVADLILAGFSSSD